MASNTRDTSGLSEVRLFPDEEKNNPFSLFKSIPAETIITGCNEHSFPPFNAVTNDTNVVTFMIPPFSQEYLKLNSFRLRGTARLMEKTAEGGLKKPDSPPDLSVVNSLPTSCWNRVSVKLNDLEIDQGAAQAYAYKVS